MERNAMIKEFKLENDYLLVSFLNYGGIITGIYNKKNQPLKNLVSAFEFRDDYLLHPDPYLNALVGPTAGRIANGQYKIESKDYQLSQNDGANHLHGGKSGISFKFFEVDILEDAAKLILNTNHYEDGYEGEFSYEVNYILDENNFVIKHSCTPSHLTPLNMTSHLYFNLSGDMENSIENHLLKISSNKRIKINKDGYPNKIVDIKRNDIFDFQIEKELSIILNSKDKRITSRRGLDTPYLLNGNITLTDPISKNKLTIKTDVDSAVLYSANYFDKSLILNNKKVGYPYCSLAIETQDMPNGINLSKDDKYLYGPNKPYIQNTIYTFE